MLKKEPGLGLLGLGLKPTTSTLSLYIPEESRKEKKRLISLYQKKVGKDQSGADGEERAEEEGRVHIFITKLLEEEEEGREREDWTVPLTF